MKLTITEELDLCTGRAHAAAAAEALIVAYWDDKSRRYHMERAAEAIKRLADVLGLKVVERTPDIIEIHAEAAQ